MKLFAPVAALLLLAVSAFAADVDGKWTGNVSTPNGDFPVAFTFKADGAMLTGSMAGMDGNDIAIKDGMIDGANISFWLSLDMGGQRSEADLQGSGVPPIRSRFRATPAECHSSLWSRKQS